MVTHLVQAVNFVWLTGGHRHLKGNKLWKTNVEEWKRSELEWLEMAKYTSVLEFRSHNWAEPPASTLANSAACTWAKDANVIEGVGIATWWQGNNWIFQQIDFFHILDHPAHWTSLSSYRGPSNVHDIVTACLKGVNLFPLPEERLTKEYPITQWNI